MGGKGSGAKPGAGKGKIVSVATRNALSRSIRKMDHVKRLQAAGATDEILTESVPRLARGVQS